MLASQFKDYSIKDSKLSRVERPQYRPPILSQYQDYAHMHKPSHELEYQTKEMVYPTYKLRDPIEIETVI
jgi:hypothetical protein